MTAQQLEQLECTADQAAAWQQQYHRGYVHGKSDARTGIAYADALLAEIPPVDPYETGAAYVARNLELAYRIAYTRAVRFQIRLGAEVRAVCRCNACTRAA